VLHLPCDRSKETSTCLSFKFIKNISVASNVKKYKGNNYTQKCVHLRIIKCNGYHDDDALIKNMFVDVSIIRIEKEKFSDDHKCAIVFKYFSNEEA
jgi:hypothetical protein